MAGRARCWTARLVLVLVAAARCSAGQQLEQPGDPLDQLLALVSRAVEAATSPIVAELGSQRTLLDGIVSRLEVQHTRLDLIHDILHSQDARLDALNAGQHAMNASLDTIKAGQHAMNASLDTIKAGQHAMNASLDTIKAGQHAMNSSLDTIKAGQHAINASLDTIKAGLNTIKAGLNTIKAGQDAMNTDFDTLKTGLDTIKAGQHAMNASLDTIKAGLDTINAGQVALNVSQDTLEAGLDTIKTGQDALSSNLDTLNTQVNIAVVAVLQTHPPRDCSDLPTGARTGIYTLRPGRDVGDLTDAAGFCDMNTAGGGWTVIQRRADILPRQDFYLDWASYREGFGNISGEFWWGLEKVWQLTSSQDRRYELRIDIERNNGTRSYALYQGFAISSEKDGYRLTGGSYSGDAGDGLSYHVGMKFSTKDRDQDGSPGHCAQEYKGAWWYGYCGYSNLNGVYGDTSRDGVWWGWWGDRRSYPKTAEMKVRPARRV